VDLADRDAWLAEAGAVNLPSANPYLLGDANLDGVVDGLDFGIWNAHKFTAVTAWSAGDFNATGTVDGQDFDIWNNNKFTGSAISLHDQDEEYVVRHRERRGVHSHAFCIDSIHRRPPHDRIGRD
jgi:hypothetical protein